MPRFFFDTRDNGRTMPDEFGRELDGIDAVQALAVRTLTQIAGDELAGNDQHTFTIDVRDEAGEAVLTSELTFETRRF
ncbi:MAG TPA: hypothetical protein VE221_04110 [Sphingomicrobium sp.]|nr:hypothetical protein [Sphingomicrobium sp.]